MEQLPPLGRIIPQVLGPTAQIYGDLLAKHAQAIKSTSRETYAYGSHERQQLDLYTPSSSAPKPENGEPAVVLIFVYGGGFVHGDKIVGHIPGGLAYRNLGHYFSENFGFETIIPDYRLVSHGALYPSGGEDVGLVLEWVKKRYGGQKGKKICLMGNSAGGVHVATWLLADPFKARREQLIAGSNGIALAGVVLLGASLHFHTAAPPLIEVLKQYFGADYEDKAALSLLKKAVSAGELKGDWPKTLILYSELDPQFIIDSNVDFIAELGKSRKDLTHSTIQGHNHISPPFALATRIEAEEKWGKEVGTWAMEL
jgi:acetyl esterase/lipase